MVYNIQCYRKSFVYAFRYFSVGDAKFQNLYNIIKKSLSATYLQQIKAFRIIIRKLQVMTFIFSLK